MSSHAFSEPCSGRDCLVCGPDERYDWRRDGPPSAGEILRLQAAYDAEQMAEDLRFDHGYGHAAPEAPFVHPRCPLCATDRESET